MLRGELFLALGALILCAIAAPAVGDLSVCIDTSDYAKMTITSKSSGNDEVTAQVTATNPSTDELTVRVYDSTIADFADGVYLTGYSMDFILNFTGSGNTYTAIGSFKLQDKSGSDYDVQASFTSSGVSFVQIPSFGGFLTVSGSLQTMDALSSILIGSEPWVFTGSGHSSGSGNSDLNLSTVTVSQHGLYDVGALVDFYMPITGYGNPGTLEGLFTAMSVGDSAGNGTLNARISAVPIPAGVVLGFLGLAVAGLKLRQLA